MVLTSHIMTWKSNSLYAATLLKVKALAMETSSWSREQYTAVVEVKSIFTQY